MTLTDPIVTAVQTKLRERSLAGIAKYGTTLARDDLSLVEWLRHFQEELMDGALYVERVIQELKE